MGIYYGNKDTCDFASKKYIQINSCGTTSAGGVSYTVIRDAGREDYHLIYVTRGTVIATYNGRMHTMTPGDFLIYPPHAPQWYERSGESCDRWIHFNGFQVADILDDAGINVGVTRCRPSSEVKALFDRIRPRADVGSADAYNSDTGLLVALLYALGNASSTDSATFDSRIASCIAFMNDSYTKPITVSLLASRCNLSDSRFLALFKHEMGVSPISYLQNLRIEQAKHLLQSTRLSVGEVSVSVGYEDPLYFSKVFKSHVGISPQGYRENY